MLNARDLSVLSRRVTRLRPRTIVPILAVVTLSVLALMTLYESAKTYLLPSITLWESHLITIIVTTFIVGVVAFLILRELDQTEDSYRQLVELSPDAMLVQRHGTVVFANGAFAVLLGASSADELLGKHPIDFIHPDDWENAKQRMRRLDNLEPLIRAETRMIRLDGKTVFVEVVARPFVYLGKPATQVLVRNIGERKQAEQELRRSEANLAAAQRIAHIGSYEIDLASPDDFEKNPLRWSDENYRIFGYEPEKIEVSGSTFLRTVHPEDKILIQEGIKKAILERTSVTLEYRIIRPGGNVRFIHSQTNVVCDEKTNRPVRLVGTAQDITDRKKAEERFYKAFNANPEPTTITTLSEGRYIDVNEGFFRVTGHHREDVIGRTSLELNFWKRSEDRLRFAELLEKQGSVRDLEITFLTKSGEERTALDSAEIVDFDGEKCVIAIFKDITEHKSLEKQLRQAQKMEAIGQLSGGIAHDFNNLLGVIIGYSEDLEERLPPSDPLRKNSEQIHKAAQSAASLTRQLLAFSRQQMLEPRVLDLNAIVRNVEQMLQRLIGEHIDLQIALDPALGHINADQGQIEQVMLNLAVNARDAMPQGGRLTVATANVDLDDEFARLHPPQRPGRYVELCVSDTGIGMDAAIQAHIFEPFFTTKEPGKGTGLGLSTVYGVIRQSGGHIWVYSEVGFGTTFRIYLPHTTRPAVEEKPPARLRGSSRGTETILLVEDEPSLRELTRILLSDCGYTVLEAEGPNSAIELARRHAGPIHLLLTDVIMPGMNGVALAEILSATRPEMMVLHMSGYTGFSNPEILDSEIPLLQKPFTRDALRGKVREVLDAVSIAKP